MTDYVLALIPDYGLYIVFVIVFMACLGIPLPSSILVLTSGSLAAAGDLVIWQVILVAVIAFILGDQLAFNTARWLGPTLVSRLRGIKRTATLVEKSEAMLNKHGLLAVFASRTIVSPLGPFVGYVGGAIGMKWISFTLTSALGATLWTLVYTMIGYLFAGQLPQISSLVASMLIVGVSIICALCCWIWLVISWRRFEVS